MVRLSAPLLTRSFAPAFSGRIEVDVAAEDLPAGDSRLRATHGKHCLILCETQQIITVKPAIRFVELCDLRQYSSLTLSFTTVLYHALCSVTLTVLKHFTNTLAGTDYIYCQPSRFCIQNLYSNIPLQASQFN